MQKVQVRESYSGRAGREKQRNKRVQVNPADVPEQTRERQRNPDPGEREIYAVKSTAGAAGAVQKSAV